MNLLKQKIEHKTLGIGTVVQQDAGSVTVKFAEKTSKFIYPDAFTAFITARDAAAQAAVLGEIAAVQAAIAAQEQERQDAVDAVKQQQLDVRQAAKERKAIRDATPKKPKVVKTPKPKKAAKDDKTTELAE